MVPMQLPLFKAMSARMAWLGQRQAVLGQNIANADTPGFRPLDLGAQEFRDLLRGRAAMPAVGVARTHAAHLPGRAPGGGGTARGGQAQAAPYEVAPNGNAVVLEEQMAKASETALDYQLISGLYRKHLGMYRMALGNEG